MAILCQISKVRHLFSKSVLFIILNCLVFSKLFYCSAVWSGTFKKNIHKLQLAQNFAARVLTNTRKFDHISPVLRELGWFSVKHLLFVRDVTQLYKIATAQRSFHYRSINTWNSLMASTRNIKTLSNFISVVQNWSYVTP